MPTRLACLAACLGASTLAASAQDAATPNDDVRRIVVSGVGEASAAPDMATATFAVQRSAKTAREALDQSNEAMRAVLDGMRALGIEARDLQTSGFGISPEYVYDNEDDGRRDPPKLVGYEVRNGLSVRIRDVARIGDVLDRAVGLGVNSGGDIAFSIDDPAALKAEARRLAVADAASTARLVADAAGVQLGEVVRVNLSESQPPMPPVPMQRMAMEAPAPASSVPVAAGELTVSAEATMVFAIGVPAKP